MKIIDLLNKIANGELEEGFSFAYEGLVWKYYKYSNKITNKDSNDLGFCYNLDRCLNDKIDVINDVINNIVIARKNDEWIPNKKEVYSFVDLDSMQVDSCRWNNDKFDNVRLNHRVIFKTKKEAEEYLEYLQEKQKHMNTFTTKEEWKNLNVIKYYFTYDCLYTTFIIFDTGTCKENKLYFKSKEKAVEFVEEYERQIKHELGVE